jgi:hypothetical protein
MAGIVEEADKALILLEAKNRFGLKQVQYPTPEKASASCP